MGVLSAECWQSGFGEVGPVKRKPNMTQQDQGQALAVVSWSSDTSSPRPLFHSCSEFAFTLFPSFLLLRTTYCLHLTRRLSPEVNTNKVYKQ